MFRLLGFPSSVAVAASATGAPTFAVTLFGELMVSTGALFPTMSGDVLSAPPERVNTTTASAIRMTVVPDRRRTLDQTRCAFDRLPWTRALKLGPTYRPALISAPWRGCTHGTAHRVLDSRALRRRQLFHRT